ncbi:MAG: hypothetical protein JSW54_09205 [Fidelibacterota bacterium]|nr:MAG: hypothetical protein JSW54_09205 [Candidatus Neomarinimicrobiota bacterium]
MKTKIVISMLLLTIAPLSAQEQTLLSGHSDHGGFGGPTYQLTQFGDQFAFLSGGRGGWIIDHTIYLGAAGYGLAHHIKMDTGPQTDHYLNLGYGGLELGAILASNRLIHATVSTLAGGGGANYLYKAWDGDLTDESVMDAFYIIEPSLQLIVNVTRYFRIGMGASYRYVSGVELEGISDDYLSGPSASLTFKFGKF